MQSNVLFTCWDLKLTLHLCNNCPRRKRQPYAQVQQWIPGTPDKSSPSAQCESRDKQQTHELCKQGGVHDGKCYCIEGTELDAESSEDRKACTVQTVEGGRDNHDVCTLQKSNDVQGICSASCIIDDRAKAKEVDRMKNKAASARNCCDETTGLPAAERLMALAGPSVLAVASCERLALKGGSQEHTVEGQISTGCERSRGGNADQICSRASGADCVEQPVAAQGHHLSLSLRERASRFAESSLESSRACLSDEQWVPVFKARPLACAENDVGVVAEEDYTAQSKVACADPAASCGPNRAAWVPVFQGIVEYTQFLQNQRRRISPTMPECGPYLVALRGPGGHGRAEVALTIRQPSAIEPVSVTGKKAQNSSLFAQALTGITGRFRQALSQQKGDIGAPTFTCNLVSLQMDCRDILCRLLDLPVAGL
jgi:hypothetical protein